MLLFISAAGIAVREIAPHLKSKAEDPAVLCADERGLHVISLLSGHLGGANEWCERIARIIGADPVITTATDLHRVFAVDLFAKEQRLVFKDTATIKEVSARLLRGEKVGYFSEAEAYKTPPAELSPHLVQGEETPNCGITIALTENLPRQFPVECRLYPKNLYLGIGCKKGKTKEELYHFLQEVFEKNKLPQKRIAALCSIREKEDEAGLCALAETLRVPFYTYPADELAALTGDFTESEFVSKTVGVGNVCERSAVRAAGPDAPLILRKTAHEGMTLAVAERRNL